MNIFKSLSGNSYSKNFILNKNHKIKFIIYFINLLLKYYYLLSIGSNFLITLIIAVIKHGIILLYILVFKLFYFVKLVYFYQIFLCLRATDCIFQIKNLKIKIILGNIIFYNYFDITVK